MLVVTELPLDHLVNILLLLLQAVHVLLLDHQVFLHVEQLQVEPVEVGLLPHHLSLQVSLKLLVRRTDILPLEKSVKKVSKKCSRKYI